MSVRDILMPGSKPNMIPVRTETKIVKSSTRESSPISSARGTVSGIAKRAAAVPHFRQNQPEPAAQRRQQNAFGKQLAQNPHLPRTERGTH